VRFSKKPLLRLAAHLGRSPLAVALAARVRDNCNVVIRESLSDGIDPRRNGELDVIRALAPRSSVFVDVGANVGDWTELFLDVAPAGARGLMIEPSEEAAARLEERFAAHPELELRRAAASDHVGAATFYEGAGASESSPLLPESLRTAAVRRDVEVTTLDAEAERLGLARIDFVKVDAEGHDLHVLRGAAGLLADRRIGAVQFEYHKLWGPFASTLGEPYNLLNRHGYALYLIRAAGLTPVTYEPYREYFGYTNYLAVAPQRVAEIENLLSTAG
jgi:FkbM family methyltransferase